MKKYVVAILGATGAVGREMIKVLEEKNFPIEKLILLASKRSVSKTITYLGKEIAVQEATISSFKGVDIVFGATSSELSKFFLPYIKEAHAVYIDNSSAFRGDDNVPLVVPEINGDDIKLHQGVIANPNCSTIITLMAIYALNKISPIKTMIASTYQAVSGAGANGPIELEEEVNALSKGESYEPKVFEYQIAYNVLPRIGNESFQGYTSEEMKLQNESRKILHLSSLKASCTCVRVPVVRSHSISVTCVFENEVRVEEARLAISKANGCILKDDLSNKIYPMPLETSDQDLVYVGRIRKDLALDNALTLWCSGDQVRKGAATNAIQIAEKLISFES